MPRNAWFYVVLCFAGLFTAGCVKPYEPPEITAATSLLVVDGALVAGAGTVTTIKLSRTRRLNDTTRSIPETGASVVVESKTQERFQLSESAAGTYSIRELPLRTSGQYRLVIQTANGVQASSDFVSLKESPPVDSLNWKEENGFVTIFISTRDPRNNTRYYRWEYEETWEDRVAFEAVAAYENGVLFFRDTNDLRYRCWKTAASTSILLGTSGQLAQDVINKKPLVTIKAATEKMGWRYSMLVKQYALTKEAFDYWEVLQKNTEQLGSLFDAQPSQLKGNFYNTSKPEEPVIGFLTASTVTSNRIFIRQAELTDKYPQANNCPVLIVPNDSVVLYMESLQKKPAYFITGGGVAITDARCVDCTLQGGTNKKPVFW